MPGEKWNEGKERSGGKERLAVRHQPPLFLGVGREMIF